jgi:hypothetical protein
MLCGIQTRQGLCLCCNWCACLLGQNHVWQQSCCGLRVPSGYLLRECKTLGFEKLVGVRFCLGYLGLDSVVKIFANVHSL